MNLEDEFELEHLLLTQRCCRICNKTKDLLDNFYITRKDRGAVPSAYSYECKECTIKRISSRREKNKQNILYNPVPRIKDIYPDW